MNATAAEYSPLTLARMRNGSQRGTFVYEGHEITVSVQSRESGKVVAVRACSDTHPSLTRVLADVGLLVKRGVGRYELRSPNEIEGYEDRGTIAVLAERLTRYALG